MASSSASGTPVHLVVLCHGLFGEPRNLHTLATLLCRSLGSRARISTGSGGKRSKEQVGPEDQDSLTSCQSDGSGEEGSIDAAEEARLASYIEDFVTERSVEEQDMDVVILNSLSNKGGKTYDGIDWIAERVIREIKAEERELAKLGSKYVARFSIIGYSLGGLVARYAIALLDSQCFFSEGGSTGRRPVEARQFITIASPHIGIPPSSGTFGKMANYVGGRLLGRTGEQLYLLDSGWDSEGESQQQLVSSRPTHRKVKVGLVESMSRPGSTFLRALNRFQKVTFYANAVNDITVPFRTGCIEEWDPFTEQPGSIDVKLLPDTPLLLQVEPREGPKPTRRQQVRAMLPTLPFFLNPKRVPFKPPYNYLAFLALPVLLPTIIVFILYRFASESRKSRMRVLELSRDWDMEEGQGQGERGRIDRVIGGIVLGVAEDNVEGESNIVGNATAGDQGGGVAKVVDAGKGAAALKRSPFHPTMPPAKRNQSELLDAQKRMVRSLNDPTIVPRLQKRWAYFDDVVNSHAIIACRTPSIEVHRRGLAVLKHLVDDFRA